VRTSRPAGRPARVAAVVLLATTLTTGARAQTVERIAGSGDPGPTGLPQSQVLAPAEGPDGSVVFLSRLTAVFRRGNAGADVVLGAGAAVPDGVVAGVGDATMDDAGCAVVAATLVGGSEGIYRVCPDATTTVVSVGAVTTGGMAISRIDFGTVVAAGPFVAFLARLDDGADAVLRTDGVTVVEIARAGTASPAGGILTTLHLAGIRTDGTVGLRATVSGGHDGLFSGTGGPLATALVEGASSLAGRVDSIDGATLSRGGLWAFVGRLEDGRGGIFRFDSVPMLPLVAAVLLVDDPIPTRPGTTVRDFPSSLVPSVNAAGDVAFRAVLGGSGSGAAVFATRGGQTAEIAFSTRDPTDFGSLARLTDPQLADDGSLLFAATPVRGGTGVFVHRGGLVSALAVYGGPTDLDRPDLPFRFVGGRVLATAEGGLMFAEHDRLVQRTIGGTLETLAAFGSPSPIGGQIAEIGPPEVDSRGQVFFRAAIADASRGEGIFATTDRGTVDRVVTNQHLRGGALRDVVQTAVELGGDLSGSGRLMAFAGLVGSGGGSSGLYLLKGRRPKRLERSGRKIRGAGKIVAFGGRPALVARRRYAFLADLRDGSTRHSVVIRKGHKRRVAALEGPSPDARVPGRLVAFTLPDATYDAVVFRATTDQGGAEALFVDDWRQTRVAVAAGESDGDGRVLRSFERPVLAGPNVVVAAMEDDGTTVGEALLRFDAAAVATQASVPLENVLRTGDALPGGGLLHDITGVRGTARGAVLLRVAVRSGPERQMLLRVTPPPNLDPSPTSQ
jgi:hypothetical protein